MDSAIMDKISEGIIMFTEQGGERPGKIVMNKSTHDKIDLEDVLRGTITKIHNIPVIIREDCPNGMIYFLNEYALEV